MSETGANDPQPATDEEIREQQEDIGEVQDQLDADSDEDGLGAEAGTIEENGISQG